MWTNDRKPPHSGQPVTETAYAMIGKRILGWLFALAITAASGVAVYRHLHARASHRVRTEILKVADDMDLPADRRDDVKRFIAGAHDEAFDRA